MSFHFIVCNVCTGLDKEEDCIEYKKQNFCFCCIDFDTSLTDHKESDNVKGVQG